MISSAMLAAEDPLSTTSERNQVSDCAERQIDFLVVKISVLSVLTSVKTIEMIV